MKYIVQNHLVEYMNQDLDLQYDIQYLNLKDLRFYIKQDFYI
jgi:hypothetical protein